MKKTLIIGIATLAIAGSTLIASSIYAANSGTGISTTNKLERTQMGGQRMINSLSGQVSNEALTALQTLMATHRTEMDTARNSGTELTQTQIDTHRSEMDALFTKYPELKTAMANTMPQGGKMGRGMGQGKNAIDTIISSVSETDKAAIAAIRSEYRTKQDALRTEEETKISAIIAKYPELKTRLDEAEKNRPQFDGNGPHRNSGSAATSTQ